MASLTEENTLVIVEVADASAAPVRTKPREQADTKRKQQPPYAVILHNDDINSFEYVVATLRKVFGFGLAKAFRLTLEAHTSGKAVVWSGMREHAELKADQIRSCGPDPVMASKGAGTLRVSIEPQA